MPVWRPAFQAVAVAGEAGPMGGGATCAARSVARAGLEAGVPSRRRRRRGRPGGWRCDVRRAERRACRSGDRRSKPSRSPERPPGGWRCDVRRAERRACRSGDRRSKPSRSPERPGRWVAVRRAPRGASPVPVWRPAFQAVAVAGEARRVGGGATCAARSTARAGLETGVPSGCAIRVRSRRSPAVPPLAGSGRGPPRSPLRSPRASGPGPRTVPRDAPGRRRPGNRWTPGSFPRPGLPEPG